MQIDKNRRNRTFKSEFGSWADPGGLLNQSPPKTNETYFICYDFEQFGKQYSQYNSENSIRKT